MTAQQPGRNRLRCYSLHDGQWVFSPSERWAISVAIQPVIMTGFIFFPTIIKVGFMKEDFVCVAEVYKVSRGTSNTFRYGNAVIFISQNLSQKYAGVSITLFILPSSEGDYFSSESPFSSYSVIQPHGRNMLSAPSLFLLFSSYSLYFCRIMCFHGFSTGHFLHLQS